MAQGSIYLPGLRIEFEKPGTDRSAERTFCDVEGSTDTRVFVGRPVVGQDQARMPRLYRKPVFRGRSKSIEGWAAQRGSGKSYVRRPLFRSGDHAGCV